MSDQGYHSTVRLAMAVLVARIREDRDAANALLAEVPAVELQEVVWHIASGYVDVLDRGNQREDLLSLLMEELAKGERDE